MKNILWIILSVIILGVFFNIFGQQVSDQEIEEIQEHYPAYPY